MAMNLLHQRRCSSVGWADMVRDELLPWALADVELGDRTLEIGPGYGATLRALVERAGAVTAVEVDKPMAERLDRLYGDRARVIHGDGSNTGLPDTSFASVVCFTMLHHVPTDRLQDQLFAEAFRVLRPGRGVRRHRPLTVTAVPAHPYRRYLQPDPTRRAEDTPGPGGVHRHSHGRGGRPTALARKQTRLGGMPVS
jgi:SAM-dependent methyltransferase